MKFDKEKSKIKSLIADDRVDETFRYFFDFLKTEKSKLTSELDILDDIENQLILLSSQRKKAMREENLGLGNQSETINRIKNSILELASEIGKRPIIFQNTISEIKNISSSKQLRIDSLLKTNKKEVTISVKDLKDDDIVEKSPIKVRGKIAGIDIENRQIWITAYIKTDIEYKQSSGLIGGNGTWEIEKVHFGERNNQNHLLYFRLFDEFHKEIVKSDSIKLTRRNLQQ